MKFFFQIQMSPICMCKITELFKLENIMKNNVLKLFKFERK